MPLLIIKNYIYEIKFTNEQSAEQFLFDDKNFTGIEILKKVDLNLLPIANYKKVMSFTLQQIINFD